ncbi:hypothetical protein SAMN04489844_4100 [Nocardioides exalbidus]|uniref:WD40-like Beta Propeller Repeat n=1 Tax=Nocardioides exalbidus TaxID=402596 RepID=A0A1H4ZHB3_9ACTN|nr:hypothetical protein [Nocardioides exalbidus]SED28780.1 hypothetical protein SAMN04489844_4100 [Nocardioides exalbidus]
MPQLRHLSVALAAALVVVPVRADAAEGWATLEEAGGHALAIAVGDGTTALVSVGGPDEATVYDQRRAPDGTLGPVTEVLTVPDADYCRPVEAAAAAGSLAVAVECQQQTDFEDPPTTLAELVWTGDGGWAWHVRREGVLGSLDFSPRGKFVAFTSNSQYGRPHHVTSYHPDLGWRDVRRRERGVNGDTMVAAIDDRGDVVALRGAGFEDEPGYWFGGRLALESYDGDTGRWTERFAQRFPDGGIRPAAIDLVGQRLAVTLVETRSTGKVNGVDERVVLLSGRAGHPRTWSSRWTRGVLTADAAITGAGVGLASWQALVEPRVATPRFATWPPSRSRPRVHDLAWRTTTTTAAAAGEAMDLSVATNGRGVIAWTRHGPGDDHTDVAGATFRVHRSGRISDQVDVTWSQPVGVTVEVAASGRGSSVTLGSLSRPGVSYSLGP